MLRRPMIRTSGMAQRSTGYTLRDALSKLRPKFPHIPGQWSRAHHERMKFTGARALRIKSQRLFASFWRSVHGQERRRNQIYRKNSKQHAGRVWGLGCTGNRHATCRIQTLCSSVDTSARKIDEMTEEKKLSDCRERIQSKPNQVRNDFFLSPRADDSEERRSSVTHARIQDNP